MKKISGLLFAGLILMAGCEPTVSTTPTSSVPPVVEESTTEVTKTEKSADGTTITKEKVTTTHEDTDLTTDPSDGTREEFIADAKARLDQLDTKLKNWEERAAVFKDDMKVKWEKERERLEKRRDKMREELARLQDASSDAWVDLKIGARSAWNELKESFSEAASHFEKDETVE